MSLMEAPSCHWSPMDTTQTRAPVKFCDGKAKQQKDMMHQRKFVITVAAPSHHKTWSLSSIASINDFVGVWVPRKMLEDSIYSVEHMNCVRG